MEPDQSHGINSGCYYYMDFVVLLGYKENLLCVVGLYFKLQNYKLILYVCIVTMRDLVLIQEKVKEMSQPFGVNN